MAKGTSPYFMVPIVVITLLISFVLYMVMVYPEERANMLEPQLGMAIDIKNNIFTPASVNINVGKTVTWRNRDINRHRIVGVDFSSGILEPGGTYSHTFTKTGVYDYSCELYPGMKGTIIVT